MRTFGIPFPLLDKADGGSGGGGGDGGGKQEPAGLSEDLKKEVGGMIAAALKGEGKRMVAASVKEAITELKLGETIAAEVAKLKPAEPDDKDKDRGKPDPKVSALEAKLQEVTAALKAQADATKAAEEAAKNERAFASLKTALGPHVRPEALEIAARDLFTGQRRVTVDEQGNVLLRVRRAPYAGAAEEDTDMPLADGVQHWVKTPEGKFFAPVPGANSQNDPRGGAGPRRNLATGPDGLPRYDTPATTDAEKIRRAEERAEALKAKYPNL